MQVTVTARERDALETENEQRLAGGPLPASLLLQAASLAAQGKAVMKSDRQTDRQRETEREIEEPVMFNLGRRGSIIPSSSAWPGCHHPSSILHHHHHHHHHPPSAIHRPPPTIHRPGPGLSEREISGWRARQAKTARGGLLLLHCRLSSLLRAAVVLSLRSSVSFRLISTSTIYISTHHPSSFN
ncbi:uncharacterized protein ARB_04123 [Trichophyton benhamiae CBS 112371]|uniref:Uncharacterized protein n=1 Tax=Arthroderma benhamiae (strain ATCC MYA-4681 / CBS 112371) TaxID=663331 RepID=D4AIM8_ARTBC|nr:uncharacterized protein ARB_04123 [Trichophyton benhamiae CBS 112371]EFE36601.1 hypothetical protein ARB_04123 [Trichophyton benhamiae CBS 112371]